MKDPARDRYEKSVIERRIDFSKKILKSKFPDSKDRIEKLPISNVKSFSGEFYDFLKEKNIVITPTPTGKFVIYQMVGQNQAELLGAIDEFYEVCHKEPKTP